MLPLLYVLGAGLILLVLFLFKPATTLPGLVIVATRLSHLLFMEAGIGASLRKE